jgi:hypothetical protein
MKLNDPSRKEISIGIVDNDIYEDDEQFLVRLSQVKAFRVDDESHTIPARLGAAATATVLIVDDDHAGAFGFTSEKFKVAESDGAIVLNVCHVINARHTTAGISNSRSAWRSGCAIPNGRRPSKGSRRLCTGRRAIAFQGRADSVSNNRHCEAVLEPRSK